MVVEMDSDLTATPAHDAARTSAWKSPPRVGPDRMVDAWREGTRTRAWELTALNEWIRDDAELTSRDQLGKIVVLHDAVARHLDAAVAATQATPWWHPPRTGTRMQAAMSNLDAAEASLLQAAPAFYLLGQMPSVLNDVQRHLTPQDARRKELENIAKTLKANESPQKQRVVPDPRHTLVEAERSKIVSALRGARSASLREQTRLRSIRNLIVVTALGMTAVAVTLGFIGWRDPAAIPLCFAPEASGQTTVVCPTEQLGPVANSTNASTSLDASDIDELINRTVRPYDIALVELIGVTAAAVAAAGAIRRVRGSSEPYWIPIALAVLKLPTGAVTAFLGLLLMRGGFVPGLSALDTSAQILAWAIVFGYAQQLFTRLVDQQAHSVLDSVRGGNRQAE